MTRTRTLEFWCELASPYTYLAAWRIDELAARAGVTVRWRPFVLGPIFAAAGWATSPFLIYPDKGRYLWLDVAREARRLGVPFHAPSPTAFPTDSVLAAKLALRGMELGWGARFVRAAMHAHFGDDRQLGEPAVLDDVLAGLGQDGPALRAEIARPEHKGALRAATAEAIGLHLFGAPSFRVGDELFWGNDRLEQALAAAAAPA